MQLILLTLLACQPAAALTLVLPLDELLGDYVSSTDVSSFSKSTPVELGVEFNRIDSISILLDGVGQCPSGSCPRTTDFDVRFTGLNSPLNLPVFISPINIGPFAGPFSVELALPVSDALLDGVGFISVTLGLTAREAPELGPSAPGSITSASLTVVGQSIPEPSRGALSVFLLVALAVACRLTRGCS